MLWRGWKRFKRGRAGPGRGGVAESALVNVLGASPRFDDDPVTRMHVRHRRSSLLTSTQTNKPPRFLRHVVTLIQIRKLEESLLRDLLSHSYDCVIARLSNEISLDVIPGFLLVGTLFAYHNHPFGGIGDRVRNSINSKRMTSCALNAPRASFHTCWLSNFSVPPHHRRRGQRLSLFMTNMKNLQFLQEAAFSHK